MSFQLKNVYTIKQSRRKTQFKPILLYLKIDLVSLPASSRELGKYSEVFNFMNIYKYSYMCVFISLTFI